jgi:prevent-host-death family protein
MADDSADVPVFGIRELRNDTAGVLAAAEAHGHAFITNRGHVVAKLIPIDPEDRSPLDEFIRWAESWERQDTGWAAEYGREKALEADEVEVKPWE